MRMNNDINLLITQTTIFEDIYPDRKKNQDQENKRGRGMNERQGYKSLII